MYSIISVIVDSPPANTEMWRIGTFVDDGVLFSYFLAFWAALYPERKIGRAYCICSVIQSQSPISISNPNLMGLFLIANKT